MLTAYFAAALACANLGDFGGALVRLERMARPLAEVEDAQYHARATTTLSWVWRELGDLPRARDRWRALLRQAELASRLDPAVAEDLLAAARSAGSAKYQALALARLGRQQEAAQVAAALGSDYLLAQVAPGPAARAALDRLAAALPAELRAAFLARGRRGAPLNRRQVAAGLPAEGVAAGRLLGLTVRLG